MAELLLELFSEEIPSRMQARAAEDLQRLVVEGLTAQGLAVGMRIASQLRAVSRSPSRTCRRNRLPSRTRRRGPRVGAPDQAIQGFLKSAG